MMHSGFVLKVLMQPPEAITFAWLTSVLMQVMPIDALNR